MIDHKFKKKFGQNFLQDKNIIRKIVDCAKLDNDSLVIEVGPGSGALTEVLTERSKTISYEIDEELKPILEEKFGNNPNSTIIFDDFLNRNIKDDLKKYDYKSLYVIANLPYYITTPIIEKIINEKLDIEKMVLMVQKEVGDRFSSKPNSKDYSSITVFLNYFFDIKKEFIVSKNAFYPRPNVDSMIISFNKKVNKEVSKNEEMFFKLVRESFKFKRKTLKNNLSGYDWEIIKSYLVENGYKETVRAEELDLKTYVNLSNIL
jgi:16S rRNA (adenine1518-N6/adenine1519-N6)-dimethyltransferase